MAGGIFKRVRRADEDPLLVLLVFGIRRVESAKVSWVPFPPGT